MGDTNGDDDAAVSTGVQLCLSCGLCCQGFLHRHAVLEADELVFATGLGLTLYPAEAPPSDASAGTHGRTPKGFDLPCPLYQDEKCSIHPNRPKVCGDYQCNLLKKHLQGTVSLEDSQALVREAKDLIGLLRRHVGPAVAGRSIWRDVGAFLERNDAHADLDAFRKANAAFMCRHFEMDADLLADKPLSSAPAAPAALDTLADRKLPLTLAQDVLVADREDQVVISHVKTGDYAALVGVAAGMWRELLTCTNLDDVVRTLLDTYDVDEAVLRADLHAFADSLVARGFVDWEPPPPDAS